MAYSGFKRVPAARPGGTREPRHAPFVAPTGGWVSAANLAAAPKGTAQVCENFLPTTSGLKMRKGSKTHAFASASGKPIESAMPYIGGSSRKLFAGCNGGIYDLTAPGTAPPAAAVSGQTSNYYSSVNFATPGGFFMLAANGTDNIQTFNGATWTPLLSGTGAGKLDGVASNTIAHLNVYRNRIWLIEKGSMNAWYLPTDSIAGTVGQVSLAGVFQNGGSLLFSATWSLDTGAGLDDKIVFVSTEGEVAVYQGDPLDTANWGIVGRYDASPPLGKNAWTRIGGDLLIMTAVGIVPLSAIINKDPGALAIAAVSRNIQPDWVAEARQRRGAPWEIVKWPGQNLAIVTCPVTGTESVTPPICFAVNLETGAWSKITGWNTRCLVLHNSKAYFGTNDGRLVEMEITGADDGALIYYTYVGQPEHLAGVGRYTTVQQARAVFRTQNDINPLIDVAVDYQVDLASFPSAAEPTASPGEWDIGLWDVARWDVGLSVYTVQTHWVSIGKSGFAHAPVLQIVSGSAAAPTAELVMFEMTHQPGALVI